MTWEENQELIHYGVKGQKWGVRNYQNPDGSLTAEGKARYAGYTERPDKGIIRKTIASNGGEYAFAKWRQRRHIKNLEKAKAQGKGEKIAKYESKLQAQGAANADMDAYRRHRSAASLMLTSSAYKHARARGSSRGTALLETYGNFIVPGLGTALRMDNDKRKYGKYIVYSDNENGIEYTGNGIRK